MTPTQFILAINNQIKADNYKGILEALKDPDCDINQYGRLSWTPLHCAIDANKPALVELFLLMNANPFQPNTGGQKTLTPRMLAEKKDNPELLSLFPAVEINQQLQTSEFMAAIESSNGMRVEEMLFQGFAYNDHTCYAANQTALGVAVHKGSFAIVQSLVKRGAMVNDADLQTWLKANAQQPQLQPIIQLLQLEKQKQIQIMQVFCAASGTTAKEKLNACRGSITTILSNFDGIVRAMKVGWNNTNQGSAWRDPLMSKLDDHRKFPAGFAQACHNMSKLVLNLQSTGELSPPEAFDLIGRMERLIDNPSEYKEFLTAAKGCQMVAGGKLSAYMMLIAGWAAKIVTVGFQGDAWIRLATEKLERIETIEQLASASEERLGTIPSL